MAQQAQRNTKSSIVETIYDRPKATVKDYDIDDKLRRKGSRTMVAEPRDLQK
jgi:hypothetical protein